MLSKKNIEQTGGKETVPWEAGRDQPSDEPSNEAEEDSSNLTPQIDSRKYAPSAQPLNSVKITGQSSDSQGIPKPLTNLETGLLSQNFDAQIGDMPDSLIENLDEKEYLKNLKSPDESPEKPSKEALAPIHKNVFQHGGPLGTISEKR